MSDILDAHPIVPVVAIERPETAVPLAKALARGGINAIEITLRTELAVEAIRAVKADCPDMLLGVGTILTPKDVELSAGLGADFLVSPALAPKLQDALLATGIPTMPGTSSPTEALSAFEAGFEILKLFPAGAVGGVDLLKGINAPMPLLKFMPTGGVRPSNVVDYMSLPNVVACGGTWVAKSADISAEKFDQIEQNAREAMALVAEL